MCRALLVLQLEQAAEAILAEAQAVQRAQELHDAAKEALADREAHALINSEVEGKNAETREASLRVLTTAERREVATTGRALAVARLSLAYREHQLQAWRACALVMGDGQR
jgi:hypothetical protein